MEDNEIKEEVITEGKETVNDESKSDTTDNELKEVEDEEAEFDEDDGSHESEVETKKKQSKEENHKYAEIRRAKEQAEKEEKARKEAYNKGLIDGVGGKNPYTGEKIEDEDDLEIYQNMKEIEKRGGDPVEEYAKYSKIFKQEAKVKESEAQRKVQEEQEKISKDINLFKEKYPKVDLKTLMNDEDFKEFALPSINRGEPVSEAYERYLKFTSKNQKVIEVEAQKKVARQISSPGSLTGNGQTNQKSFLEMSTEEFRKFQKEHGL